MATRSVIAKLDSKGIKAVYCHNDGYLKYNGKLLSTHYTNENKVDKLLAEGDISSLGREIGIKTDFNSSCYHKGDDFNYQCKFYARDRGEKGTEAQEFKDDIALLDSDLVSIVSNGFVYLYAYGTWYVYDNQTIKHNGIVATYKFIELEEVLKEVNV
jgi:hypothetical protein